MRVTVKLFAGLRERAGWGERELEAASIDEVWPQLGLGEEPAGLLYAVNQEYADRSMALAEGDEVAIIPPVSGGAFRLVDGPLDLAAVVAEVEDERAGAIATFQGTVRRQSRGRQVIALEYEAYAGMAEKVMAEIAEAAMERHDLCQVAIAHRAGRCEVGEVSVAIAVSAAHRHPALTACREIIDELKGRVPLWKKELYEGGEEWIGRGS
jgi:molybdopterin synthase catalytic subunit/molybdopterin converting factor small subunit